MSSYNRGRLLQEQTAHKHITCSLSHLFICAIVPPLSPELLLIFSTTGHVDIQFRGTEPGKCCRDKEDAPCGFIYHPAHTGAQTLDQLRYSPFLRFLFSCSLFPLCHIPYLMHTLMPHEHLYCEMYPELFPRAVDALRLSQQVHRERWAKDVGEEPGEGAAHWVTYWLVGTDKWLSHLAWGKTLFQRRIPSSCVCHSSEPRGWKSFGLFPACLTMNASKRDLCRTSAVKLCRL